jgi:hypothetical protein
MPGDEATRADRLPWPNAPRPCRSTVRVGRLVALTGALPSFMWGAREDTVRIAERRGRILHAALGLAGR